MTTASPVVRIGPSPINHLNHYPLKATVSGQSCELLSPPVNTPVSKQCIEYCNPSTEFIPKMQSNGAVSITVFFFILIVYKVHIFFETECLFLVEDVC